MCVILAPLASVYLDHNPYPGSVFSGNRFILLGSQALKCIESNPTWALNIPSRSPPAPPRREVALAQFNSTGDLSSDMVIIILWNSPIHLKRTLTDTKFLLKRNFSPSRFNPSIQWEYSGVFQNTFDLSYTPQTCIYLKIACSLSVATPLFPSPTIQSECSQLLWLFSGGDPGFSCSLISCSLPMPHGFLLSLKHVQHFLVSVPLYFFFLLPEMLFPQVAARFVYFFHFA